MAYTVQFRRGLDADRTKCIPLAGEPLFCTDTKKLFIGDGETPGGIEVLHNAPPTAGFMIVKRITDYKLEKKWFIIVVITSILVIAGLMYSAILCKFNCCGG